MSNRLQDRDWLYEQYITKHRTQQDIADEIGCAKTAVQKALVEHDVRRDRLPSNIPELRDQNWLHDQYIVKGKTLQAIADEINASMHTVMRVLERYGIDRRTGTKRIPKLHDRKWLFDQYVENNRTLQDMADELECNKQSVGRALQRFGIKRRKRTVQWPVLHDREWMYEQYVVNERTMKDIANELGTSAGNVGEHLRQHDIPVRGSRPHWSGYFGEDAANWKGGIHQIDSGYIYIYRPEHPNATKKGYVMEHRLVMEEKLGRLLERDEVCHHVNGKKDDNRPENLVVKKRGQHMQEHFEDGHEAYHLRQENKQLKARIKELEAELAECKGA